MAKDTLAAAVLTVPLEEAAWVEQARTGDMNALTRLVTRYQDRILNTCWRVCGNLEDAQDLAQEAFLKAIESIGTFRQKANFYTWLFRIAVNVSISHRRKSARAVKLSLHGRDGELIADRQAIGMVGRVSEEPQEPPARLSARETERRVLAALNDLDDEHRAVLVLRDMESFDYHQIAEILEVPVGTVKSRLHRARIELRGRLRPVVEDE
jgi:RNA polymerase sigma-70 factor, ECF subfamily